MNAENFNRILSEMVGGLARKTKFFSKKKQRLQCAVTLFLSHWNFMNEFRGQIHAMIENIAESLWSREDFFMRD